MAPIGSLHTGTIMCLTSLFAQALAGRAILSSQNPVLPAERSKPQPDIAVLRNRIDFYRNFHPVPEDAFLLVEVADATLSYDRDIKILLHARHGIPEVWLVDLNARNLEIHRQPTRRGVSRAAPPGEFRVRCGLPAARCINRSCRSPDLNAALRKQDMRHTLDWWTRFLWNDSNSSADRCPKAERPEKPPVSTGYAFIHHHRAGTRAG